VSKKAKRAAAGATVPAQAGGEADAPSPDVKAAPVVVTECDGVKVGQVVRFRLMSGEYIDATVAKLNVADGALASCDLDVQTQSVDIPDRTYRGKHIPAYTKPPEIHRHKSIRRDAVRDGVHEPFTWLPKGEEA
jgi:hypothetical protein